ncbi:MAG: EAL domain-containing protein, partial [Betaproteobacteria bacterium]|nr:EAL domain-containing protein [Betaproteobacteria bacterium]
YAEICASFDRDIDAELMQAIIERITFAEGRPTFYQGEQQLCWLAPDIAINTLQDHLAGLARVLETSVQIGERNIDLKLSFGIDDRRARPTKTRLASALLAAQSAAQEQTLVATYQGDEEDRRNWQLSILGEMDAAIEARQVWIAYQPQFNVHTSRISGAEALVRWTHPTRGMIAPDEFVRAAEDNNRIERLTTFVLTTAMSECSSLTVCNQPFNLAVNISAALLNSRSDFADYIRTLAYRHRFPLTALTLEITETAQIRDPETAKAALLQLANEGVTIAIDDYGTGNASLGYLRSFPASEIKIDKSFITGMTTNPRDALLVESTIAMTHRLDKTVVAEGVEDAATMKLLVEYGCDVIQGYHIGKPQPIDTLLKIVADNRLGRMGRTRRARGSSARNS